LVEVNSLEENEFIQTLNSTAKTDYIWIGATDIFLEQHWIWIGSKGSVSSYANWEQGEPNHYGGEDKEDCAILGMENGKWLDIPCKTSLKFVCEYELTELSQVYPMWLKFYMYFRFTSALNQDSWRLST
jgi:hypothetical protein